MAPYAPRNGRDGTSVSTDVVRTIAAYGNERPDDLPPLAEVVDTDALDAIFASRMDGTPRPEGHVRFPYAGFRVTVSADGSIDVEPMESVED